MSLKFYQVYFEEDQQKCLYPFATPYFNDTLTNYFENSVIEKLVPQTEENYIGVCSWRLRRKREDGWVPSLCKFPGYDDLSEEKILREDFDVAVLTPKSSSHKMLQLSAHWHEPNWIPAIEKLRDFIKIPQEVKTPIYENHFIARKEIYHEYVKTVLSPCLQWMAGFDVFFKDSGYRPKKERTDPQAVQRYREKTGREDWPIAPFILERLFSIWINDKNFKIVNV